MEGSSACSPSISNVSINKTTVPLAEREGCQVAHDRDDFRMAKIFEPCIRS